MSMKFPAASAPPGADAVDACWLCDVVNEKIARAATEATLDSVATLSDGRAADRQPTATILLNSLAFNNGKNPIHRGQRQNFFLSARPPDFQFVYFCGLPQAEVRTLI